MFEFFDHEADLGVIVEARELGGIFTEGVRALTACHTDLKAVRSRQKMRVEVKAENVEELFVRWLKEWLFLQDCEGFLAVRAKLERFSETSVLGAAEGEIRDSARHPVRREIKGITYHGVKVIEAENGWHAEVILDV